MSPPTYKFSIDEFDRMIAADVFEMEARVELIEGQFRERPQVSPYHEHVVDVLNEWGVPASHMHGLWHRCQNSIGLAKCRSVPVPDIALVANKSYRERRPQAEEVLLVIEVADDSLDYDRFTKGPIYAAAGIPEYWIVNIASRCVEVYREPCEDWFGSRQTIDSNGLLVALLAPEAPLDISSLFNDESE